MATPVPSSEPAAPETVSRSFSLEGDVRMLERQNKQAEIRGFTINCGEREPIGDNSAPSPLAYFATSIVF